MKLAAFFAGLVLGIAGYVVRFGLPWDAFDKRLPDVDWIGW